MYPTECSNSTFGGYHHRRQRKTRAKQVLRSRKAVSKRVTKARKIVATAIDYLRNIDAELEILGAGLKVKRH